MNRFVRLAFTVLLTLISVCSAHVPDSPTYEEVHAKSKTLTDRQLIDCLSEKHTACPLEGADRDAEMISAELRDHNHPRELISAYETGDQMQRYYIVQALWQITNPQVLEFMRSIAFENLPAGQDNADVFFPLDYLPNAAASVLSLASIAASTSTTASPWAASTGRQR
jgi:hypothetical protein